MQDEPQIKNRKVTYYKKLGSLLWLTVNTLTIHIKYLTNRENNASQLE